MEVDLTSKFDEQGHFVVAEFKDKNANTLNLNIKPNSTLNNMSEGMLTSKSFNLDESLLNSYCAGCKFNLLLILKFPSLYWKINYLISKET